MQIKRLNAKSWNYAGAISGIMWSTVIHFLRIIMKDKEQYIDNTHMCYWFLCIDMEFCHLKYFRVQFLWELNKTMKDKRSTESEP